MGNGRHVSPRSPGTSLAKPSDVGSEGNAAHRRRIELQIRAIIVSYRIERRRRDTATMQGFRDRARTILDGIEEDARRYPDLEARLIETRNELAAS